jgi:uncharacterized membrane protein YfcA
MNPFLTSLTWTELLLAMLINGMIGFLSGVFGFGGGFLLVPVLNVALGIPMTFAAGASACQVLGPATTSLLARNIEARRFRLPLIITGGLFLGASAGAWGLHWLSRQGAVAIADQTLPAADVAVLVLYLLLLGSLGGFSIYEASREDSGNPLSRGWAAKWRFPPTAAFAEFDGARQSIAVLSWFGLAVGFSAGLLGNSGGVLLLPGLVYLLGMRTQEAVVSSLVIVWVLSLISTAAHAWLGHVDLRLVTALLIGGTFGARWGSEVGLQLHGSQLRRWFGRLMLLTCGLILFRLLRMFAVIP